MPTITYVGQLVTTSCWCGVHMAIPSDLHSLANRKKGTVVYCPLGHKFIFGSTTEEELADAKGQLARAKKREQAVRDLLEQEENSHRATRGHVTRKKKELARVKAGVCPCCARNFSNLARHMENQHPDFKP